MRDIINLVIEDTPTNGMLPAKDLATLLPMVNDLNAFTSALMKVENGQEDALSLQEKTQLSNAFISMIRLPDNQKMLVLQKLNPVSSPVAKPQQPNQPSQRL